MSQKSYSDHIFNRSFPYVPLAIKQIMILFNISQPDLNALKWNDVENVKQYDHDCFDCQRNAWFVCPKKWCLVCVTAVEEL